MNRDMSRELPGNSKGRMGGAPTLECRECECVCELVVAPWRCLRAQSSCVYAFQDEDSTMVGCVYKVFSTEFDLAAFCGEDGHELAEVDPYGAVRVSGAPRPQCPVRVERSVHGRADRAAGRITGPSVRGSGGKDRPSGWFDGCPDRKLDRD